MGNYRTEDERLNGMVFAVAAIASMEYLSPQQEKNVIEGLAMAAEGFGYSADEVRERITQAIGTAVIERALGGCD